MLQCNSSTLLVLLFCIAGPGEGLSGCAEELKSLNLALLFNFFIFSLLCFLASSDERSQAANLIKRDLLGRSWVKRDKSRLVASALGRRQPGTEQSISKQGLR